MLSKERSYQIGVVGSFSEKNLPPQLVEIAEKLGKKIAESGHALIFGVEQDGDSLSTQAAIAARRAGGISIAVAYGSKGEAYNPDSFDYLVWTGSERGGPRESILILSADGVIAMAGGSGTLTEMMIAYMNRRPVVVIKDTGGWSDKLAGQFFDDRKRAKAEPARSPEEAVDMIIDMIDDQKSRRILNAQELARAAEFKAFESLVRERGQTIASREKLLVRQIYPKDFETVKQRIGLALLANVSFKTDMGLSGISVTDSPYGRINLLMKDGDIIGFQGEKIYNDPFGRTVHYIDIVGIVPWLNGKGQGQFLCESSIFKLKQETGKEIILVSRTQNPMLVSMIRKSLPPNAIMYPISAQPTANWIESVNWLVESGEISRNKRPDSRFDARQSLIYWGAYGKHGDGTTWENMIKQFKEIDWNREDGTRIELYLTQNGTSTDEMLSIGHALMIGASTPKRDQ